MTQPFPVKCPSCGRGFQVNNPQLVGKNVKCPSCQVPFLIQGPAVHQAQPAAPRPAPQRSSSSHPAADDPLGLGDSSAWETGSDPLSDPLGDPLGGSFGGGSTLAGPNRRKYPRRSSGGLADVVKNPMVWLGVGGVAAVLLLVFGLLLGLQGGGDYGGSSSSGNLINMTWLPSDAEAVGFVDLQAVLNSSQMRQIRDNPRFQEEIAQIEQDTGITLDDLRSVTIGLPAKAVAAGSRNSPFDEDRVVAVIRVSRVPDFAKLADSGLQQRQHGDKDYYVGPDESLSFWAPDSQTVVMAAEPMLKAAIDSGGVDPRRPEFDFVKRGQHGFFAWAPQDRSVLSQSVPDSAAMPPGSGSPKVQESAEEIRKVVKNELQAICFGGRIRGGSMAVNLQAVCSSSNAAGRMVSGIDALLAEWKNSWSQTKRMLNPEMVSQFEQVMNSLDVSRSGSTATLTVSIPDTAGNSNNAAMAALLPALQRANMARKRTQGRQASRSPATNQGLNAGVNRDAMNDLKQIGIALHNHHDVHRKFPPRNDSQVKDASGKPKLSWRVHILPFLGHEPLFKEFRLNEPWDSPHNRTLIKRMPDVFRPAGTRVPSGKTTYLAVSGPATIFENGDGRHLRDVVDGSANTAMVVQVADNRAVTWTQPKEFEYNASNPAAGLTSPTGTNFLALLADGSVHVRSTTQNPQELLKLFRINDGAPAF